MNQAVVDLIARTLPHGLPHPGDDHRPPSVLPTPFRGTGMSDEQAEELIGSTTRLWAEAITHLIESDHEILTKADAQHLRQAAADAPDGTRIVQVHVSSVNTPPVLELTIGKTDHAVVPAAAINALKAAC